MLDVSGVAIAVAAGTIVLLAIITRFYQKNTNAICKSKKRLEGKIVLITGGTAGMGLEMAKDLARRGARIIVACPFEQEGIDARKTIIENSGNQNVHFKHLNLASLSSVKEFAKDILKNEDRLDILINNAGVLTPDDVETADGLGFVMQVNYFGLFLLTILLLPLLKKTGKASEPSRIVNMSSVLHIVGTVDFNNMNKVGYWFKWRIYCNSKLCVAMFTKELSEKLMGSNVVVNSVDPGAVGTGIFDSCGKFMGFFLRTLFGTLFKTAWEGAQTALHVALDDKAGEMSGEFFKNCALSRAIYTVYNEKQRKMLWEQSIRILNLEKLIL